MITVTNKLVLSILFSLVPTTLNNRCCSINAEQQCRNNSAWTILFVEQYCSAMITVLLRHCSTNNAVTTCTISSCVGSTRTTFTTLRSSRLVQKFHYSSTQMRILFWAPNWNQTRSLVIVLTAMFTATLWISTCMSSIYQATSHKVTFSSRCHTFHYPACIAFPWMNSRTEKNIWTVICMEKKEKQICRILIQHCL